MTTSYATQRSGFYGGGMGNEAAINPPAVRFDPSQLNVQPRPGYMNMPGYSPFLLDQDRTRFILHDPRSGVAGNPFACFNPRLKTRWNAGEQDVILRTPRHEADARFFSFSVAFRARRANWKEQMRVTLSSPCGHIGNLVSFMMQNVWSR
jgi:hypothetical protein